MIASKLDVIVIGAGAAGLAAFEELRRGGCKVLCVEAKGRIGGRIRTIHDPLSPIPIELGAEFIHGRPREIWDIVNSHGLAAYDCAEKAIHIENGQVRKEGDAWQLISSVMEDMQKSAAKGKDRTFASFLDQSPHPANAKGLAASYVEGFNAARKERIGIASLAEDAAAAGKIDGDHSFRMKNGYDSLAGHLLEATDGLRLNCVVERIDWQPGAATIHMRFRLTGHVRTLRCERVVITVPLGVLQADGIEFDPPAGKVSAAARALEFGHVIRVVLRFREAFWEDRQELSDAGFLLSQEPFFPTWWTPLPIHAPIVTGWSAGPHADGLLGRTRRTIIGRAITDLARIMASTPARLHSLLEAAYFHDWQKDPFIRGSYSYVPAAR